MLADRARALDATHGPARNLRAQALDTKRDELVAQHASQARRLQSSGDIDAAIAEVQTGLSLYPADPRLRAILDALTKESDRRRGRTSDVRTADLETFASPTPRTNNAVAVQGDPTVSARTDAVPSARPHSLTVPVMLDADDLMETRPVPRSGPAPPSPVSEPVPPATVSPSAVPEPQSRPGVRPARATAPQPQRKVPQSRRWVYGAAAAGAAAVVLLVGFVSLNRGAAPESVESTPAVIAPADPTPAPTAPTIENAPPVAAPAAGLATLSVGQLPPATRVSIDGAPVGTVGADGRFQYTSVKPGRHTIVFSRDSYEPVTTSRDFTAAGPVQVATADVTFRRAAVVVESLADAGTSVAVSQGDQTLHQFAGPTQLPLAGGTYQVVARVPANLPTTETL